MRKLTLFLLAVLFIIKPFIEPLHVWGQPPLTLTAQAVVLMEQSTGRVLYARGEHDRRYPASTTKMLTALVVMEHLALDTVVTVGGEWRGIPAGFSRVGHFEGETISVYTLLNGLLIPSGNDSAMSLAMAVARITDGRQDLSYAEGQAIFSRLMNGYAARLGATNSNFNNPYGLHNDSHFTTAHDMALIGCAFMANPTLAQISARREFSTNSLGNVPHGSPNVREYTWTNTNLMLPGATHGHPYITGGRTGFTTPAGHCFVAGVHHQGMDFIAVVLYSREPDRWQDTRTLIDYGIFNYAFREIAIAEQVIYTATIENPRLGDVDTLDILLSQSYTALLNHREYNALMRVYTFDPLLLVGEDQEHTVLRAPIAEGDILGTVEYIVPNSGLVVFSTPIVAGRQVYERTFDSDMDYYIAMVLGNIFTRRALPIWFGFFGVVFGLFCLSIALKMNRRARRLARWQPSEGRRRRKF